MADSTISRCKTCGEPTVEYPSNRMDDAIVGAKPVTIIVCAYCDRRVCRCGRPDATGKARKCVRCSAPIQWPTQADFAGVPVTFDAPND